MSHPRPARPLRRGSSRPRAAEPAGHPVAAGAAVSSGASASSPALLGSLRPSSASQELLCSGIGLTLKLSLAVVAGVSLVRLAGAYQQRLDRYGEISAVLDIQKAKLLKAQNRFDSLFAIGGERRLIQEQDQWIAPDRLRVVWKPASPQPNSPFPTVERP